MENLSIVLNSSSESVNGMSLIVMMDIMEELMRKRIVEQFEF